VVLHHKPSCLCLPPPQPTARENGRTVAHHQQVQCVNITTLSIGTAHTHDTHNTAHTSTRIRYDTHTARRHGDASSSSATRSMQLHSENKSAWEREGKETRDTNARDGYPADEERHTKPGCHSILVPHQASEFFFTIARVLRRRLGAGLAVVATPCVRVG